MGRSRSRSRDRRDRSRSASYDNDDQYDDGYRVHVSDLGLNPNKRDLERIFDKYGRITEIWLARNPPCFAFIVYRHKDEADNAIRDMDGQTINGGRVRVSYARPRTRGRRRRTFDPNLRCYQCGEKGHFSRDCNEIWGQRRRRRSRSNSRSFSRSRSRSHSRSRKSRRSHRSRSRSRSRSPDKSKASHQKRSRSTSKSRERRRSESARDQMDRHEQSRSPNNGSPTNRGDESPEGEAQWIEKTVVIPTPDTEEEYEYVERTAELDKNGRPAMEDIHQQDDE